MNTINLCPIVHEYRHSLHFPISEKAKNVIHFHLYCYIGCLILSVSQSGQETHCLILRVWWARNGSLMENPSIRPVHFFICPYGDGMNRKWHAFLLSDSKINSSVHFLQRRWEERKEVKREKNRSRGNKECSVKLKWASLHSRVSAVIRWILVWWCWLVNHTPCFLLL